MQATLVEGGCWRHTRYVGQGSLKIFWNFFFCHVGFKERFQFRTTLVITNFGLKALASDKIRDFLFIGPALLDICFSFQKIWKLASPVLFFLIFHLFYAVNSKCSIQLFDDEWVRTAVLCSQKQPLYQLNHNHCPFKLLFAFAFDATLLTIPTLFE